MKNNKLLMIDHDEFGTWYFTNIAKADKWIGKPSSLLDYYLSHNKHECNGYRFEWVDGTNVIYKYINPTQQKGT
jgi:hypothetical protein